MPHQSLSILGSTGSIGTQALELVRHHTAAFSVVALSCNTNWEQLVQQILEFEPKVAVIGRNDLAAKIQAEIGDTDTTILTGAAGLETAATLGGADVVLNALVGFAGFEPTLQALKAQKKVALANKESLVVGGDLIMKAANDGQGTLIPVDSEHSAIHQCLLGEDHKSIEALIITASGGPFRTWSRPQMETITIDDALDHPNWSMGAKITVDSATMMNKGLEVIEACRLFQLPIGKVQAVIHPQSIVHSIVTFIDGSSKAQLGPPTMEVPILYALAHPQRKAGTAPRLNWGQAMELQFEPVDHEQFPCFSLALQAMDEGGNAPAILNAANEIAVERFLAEEISYLQIAAVIEECLQQINVPYEPSVQALKHIDEKTRTVAQQIF